MRYNDYKQHTVKQRETVAGIAAQYGVTEDALITTNPNISLTQSAGNWFRSFKWVASVKEGDTLQIPFYNQDKAKRGVKAISGKTTVKPGEWEEYTVTEWYGGTPVEDRNEDRVKWDLYLLQTGKEPQKVLEKECGSFRFMEKAVGNRFKVVGYLYEPELDNQSALTVTVVPTQKREIQSILLKDAQFNPISGPVSYGQKINVYVSTTGMGGEYIHVCLWEDDAKEAGHSPQNEHNLAAEVITRVSDKGIASCTFLLKPDFAKMANAYMAAGDKTEGSQHEYYVTAYADDGTQEAASNNINVNNPDYNYKPATPQLRQQKIQEHLAQRKAPKRNAAIPPFEKQITVKQKVASQPAPAPKPVPAPIPARLVSATQAAVTDVYISESNGQPITDTFTGSKIRVYILSTGLKGKKVKMSLYEDDLFDQLVLERHINLSSDKHIEQIYLSKIAKSVGDDLFEGSEQELFVKIEVPELTGIIESQAIDVDVKSFKPDPPDGVSLATVVVAEQKKEEKKEDRHGCPNCNKDVTVEELKKIFTQADDDTLMKAAITYSKYMKDLKMNTCWNKAHFFAQAVVESGLGLHVKSGENFNWYYQGLITTFGAFKTVEGRKKATLWGRPTVEPRQPGVSAENQKNIANWAYSPTSNTGKELGNTQANDGWNFRGKGLIQLTGRKSYEYANNYTIREGSNIVNNPDLVLTDVCIAVLSSMAFFKWKNINILTNGKNDTKPISIKVGREVEGSYTKKQKAFQDFTSQVFKVDRCVYGKVKPIAGKAPWMPFAIKEIGQKAILGKENNNPRISEYFNGSSNGKGLNEGTNWCGAFVSWCFSQAGYTPPPLSCRAAMWQFWKQDKPIYGSAAVIDWDDNQQAKPSGKGGAVGGDGHITFVMGISEDGNYYYCIGGNQGGTKGARTVKISKYHKSDIDWFVIPSNYTPIAEEYKLKIMKSEAEADVDTASNTSNLNI